MHNNEPPKTATVLLVDDDEAVRKLLEKILRKKGYVVIVGANSDGLIELANGRIDEIDLLVCHWNMRGLDGPAIAKRVQSMRPHLPVLLLSASEPERKALDVGWVFLKKPFVASEFLEQVDRMIERSRAIPIQEQPVPNKLFLKPN